MSDTKPIDERKPQPTTNMTIAPAYIAPDGSTYVHQDLVKVTDAWAVEAHIAPFKAQEKLGSVEAWCGFVTRFSTAPAPLLTWSAAGLKAVLDYGTIDAPGRGQVVATYPFERTRQWQAWERLASNRQISQRELIEALEDRAADIKAPSAGDLLTLIKKLRGTVNAAMDAVMDDNGNVSLRQEHSTSTSLKLPQVITIAIPILKGHTVPDGNGIEGPVTYELDVRIRVDVLDGGKVAFRLSIPDSEQALEDAIADRVRAAQAELDAAEGEYEILRAAS